MVASEWKFAAASVRGKGHEQTGAPCQDACAAQESVDGRWLALVASDGAGSAAHSEVSAKLVASEFSRTLIEVAEELDRQPPGAWVTDSVIEKIVHLRKALRQKANSDNISDFHCTLVAALLGPTGGFTIHLGDGSVFGGAADPSSVETIDLSKDFFLSEPENGEYANETVFLTERDWIRHLRIFPVSSVDWLVLGTDGGMALAMVEEKTPKGGFVVPVMRTLFSHHDFDARTDALKTILQDRQADRLTNDDKTLVVAVRSKCIETKGEFQPSLAATTASAFATPTTQQPCETGNMPPKWRPTEHDTPTDGDEQTRPKSRKSAIPLAMKVLLGLVSLAILASLVVFICSKFPIQTKGKERAAKEQTATELPPGTQDRAADSSTVTPTSQPASSGEEGPK